MDSLAFKFQLPEECTCYYHAPELHSARGCRVLSCQCKWDGMKREPPAPADPSPAMLHARVEHEGSTYALTLVRSLLTDEGTAILERAPGGAGFFVQNGTWYVRTHDDAPSYFALDFDDSGDVENHAQLLDRLAAEIVKLPESWAETFEPMGGF